MHSKVIRFYMWIQAFPFIFFSISVYYRILNIASCDLQEALTVYLLYWAFSRCPLRSTPHLPLLLALELTYMQGVVLWLQFGLDQQEALAGDGRVCRGGGGRQNIYYSCSALCCVALSWLYQRPPLWPAALSESLLSAGFGGPFCPQVLLGCWK